MACLFVPKSGFFCSEINLAPPHLNPVSAPESGLNFSILKTLKRFNRTLQTKDIYIIETAKNNEVIVYRVMYANPLQIVQAMYSTFKDQSVYYSNRG